MDKFVVLDGLVAPLDRANVDTDAIIPKQFLKSINRSGFGPFAFDEWRYMDVGQPGQDCTNRPLNPQFSLNQPQFKGASVLLTRQNFGCGSSREHAPWALLDYGFRAIIAESFADIFFNNCFKNGLLPITLPSELIEQLFNEVEYNPGYTLAVDLPSQTIRSCTGMSMSFEIDATRKHRLLEGLDDIGITLQNADRIRAYEARQRLNTPWLFA